MSTGGIFSLTIKEGKQDKLLNAHEFLRKRVANYIAEKNHNYRTQDLLYLREYSYSFIDSSFLP